MMNFSSEHVMLRAPEPEDLNAMYMWENDAENWLISDTTRLMSKYTLSEFIQSEQDIYALKQLRFMINISPEHFTVGCVDLFEFNPKHQRIGIGILIGDKSYRRRGVATKALKIALEYCFEILEVQQVFCNIQSSNLASLNLFQELGFERAGVRKLWIKNQSGWDDLVFLQKFKP